MDPSKDVMPPSLRLEGRAPAVFVVFLSVHVYVDRSNSWKSAMSSAKEEIYVRIPNSALLGDSDEMWIGSNVVKM